MTRTYRLLAGLLASLCVAGVPASTEPAPDSELFQPGRVEGGGVEIRWDRPGLRAAAARGGTLTLRRFPLGSGLEVDLEVQPFAVTSRRTRFVVGRKGGPDRPLEFDPAAVSLFRGRVRGYPASSVVLAIGDGPSLGHVDLGPGAGRFELGSTDEAGRPLASGRTLLRPAADTPTLPPGVPLCGVGDHDLTADRPPADGSFAGGTTATRGLRHLELAVETDYEFFVLFGNAGDAAAYLVALYGAVSDVFVRDSGTRVELAYVRLWDDPDDLFNIVQPSPLSDFRNYWNDNMGSVPRDVAQLLSGRRDYPFGGQAYLGSLCGSNAYSVVGYASGFLTDPSQPGPYQYNASVTAHELGHNCGAFHTQDYGIDTCNNPSTTARRGPIMSYCGQTWSGGNANRDFYFHSTPALDMDQEFDASSCVTLDCNQNDVEDSTDIQQATSLDGDGNGIPDECEDCNGNGVLDDMDIQVGTSDDVNNNDIPDECEPDCNGNGIPDRLDIADGTSGDAHGNAVPDECETDCNANATSDYSEIQLDMTLDVDRDAALDSCQDCDNDGTDDIQELAGGHNLWVASGQSNSPLREFYSTTGVLTRVTSGATVNQGQDVIVAPSGNIWVSSAGNDRVKEYAPNGAFVTDFVVGGALDYPTGMTLTPDGRLLVASRNTDEVLAYDGSTGTFLGAFVAAGSGGLDAPFGLTYGPDGHLHATSDTGEVIAYDGGTGALIGVLVDAADNGGLSQPRGLTFKADGNLLVASYGTNEVLEFDGATGDPLGKWAQVGTPTVLTQVSPWGVRVGPNGNVFVVRTGEAFGSGGSQPVDLHDHHGDHDDLIDDGAYGADTSGKTAVLHLSNAQIYEFDVHNGNFLRTHIGGNDHGLLFPTGFAFVPGWNVDCNFNQLQDGCDIQSGISADANGNGTPDECEVDCNANGVQDRLDLIPNGNGLDCNSNLVPDACDIAAATSGDCTGNGIPDECEPDCNANGIADSCDLAAGSVRDCNANAVPDQCDVFDDLDGGVLPSWSTGRAGDTANDGIWVLANPIGTVAQPEFDHTPGDGRACFVTGQGSIGGSASADDVDGGFTTLMTPALDLTTFSDPEIGYWRWFSNQTGSNPAEDVLTVEVSANGLDWFEVETVGPSGPEASGGWYYHEFRVADFVSPGNGVRLRFIAEDQGGNSVVEAAIDDLVIVPDCCESQATCGDGLTCTLDSCDLLSGQCASELGPGACLIDAACHDDGALNPSDVCEVCDAAAPEVWTPALPVEIGGVLLSRTAGTELNWSFQAGAVYDVAGGDVDKLRLDGDPGGATCLANDVATTSWIDPRADPAAGEGYYYLIRAQKPCAAGTYGSSSAGSERQPTADCP